MWLYKLKNKKTGKEYIGTSVNPVSHRISRHVYAAKTNRGKMPITATIQKYGIDNFEVKTLVQCPDYEYLLNLEAKAIVAFNTRVPNGYNLTAGGRGTRRTCSQETREKISARTKGRRPWNLGTANEETLARYARRGNKGGAQRGKRYPKMSAWQQGRSLPEDVKQRIAEGVRRVRATRFWSSKKESNLSSLEVYS